MLLEVKLFENRNKDLIGVRYGFDNSRKRRIIHRFSFLLHEESNVNLAEVTLVDVIFWLEPNHRNAKLK